MTKKDDPYHLPLKWRLRLFLDTPLGQGVALVLALILLLAVVSYCDRPSYDSSWEDELWIERMVPGGG
jgi:hypothetical protein